MKSEPTEDIRTTYDRIAQSFAARWAEIPDALLPFMERLARHSSVGGLLLDVGCGHGRDVAWFEREGTAVIGMDLSIGMLREARRLTTAPLIHADMRSLPIRAFTLAAIWCCASLLHLPKSEAPSALSEFERVLRGDGLIFIGVQQGVHDAPRYSKNDGVVRHFADYMPREMATILERAGLEVMDQSTIEAGAVSWLQTIARKAA